MRRMQTNPQLVATIRYLRKASNMNNAPIWARLADELSDSKRRRPSVNISSIVRSIDEGETAAVPGKVLGSGLGKKITVAAFAFTKEARRKIEEAGGECLSLITLVERNPKGTGVRIIG
ncbi:MAG: 50S ribosomal protein L18e [Candidatus Bathyarchaeia archaeon]